MNISGIVVTTAPARVPEVAAALAAIPSLEVAQSDAAGGRLVVVQECASVAEEMEGLRRIQRLPGVISADLVVHYFGDEERPPGKQVADVARQLEQTAPAVEPGRASHPNPDSWRSS